MSLLASRKICFYDVKAESFSISRGLLSGCELTLWLAGCWPPRVVTQVEGRFASLTLPVRLGPGECFSGPCADSGVCWPLCSLSFASLFLREIGPHFLWRFF